MLVIKLLIVYCHPDATSFGAALRDAAVAALTEAGHELRLSDVYAVGFKPVFSATDRADYLPNTQASVYGVQDHVDALQRTALNETCDNVTYFKNVHGCSAMQFAEKYEWVGPDVWFAHMVHLSDDDIQRCAATGTGIARCPLPAKQCTFGQRHSACALQPQGRSAGVAGGGRRCVKRSSRHAQRGAHVLAAAPRQAA